MWTFENILKLNGFPIDEAKKKLKEIMGYSHGQKEEYYDKQKWSIVREHFENNPFYRNLCDNNFPTSWENVPIVKKKHFQTDLKNVLNRQFINKKIFKNKTSGSSGTPMVLAKDKFCHAMTWAIYIDRYAWWDISLGDKQARFWGIAVEGLPYYEQKLKDFLANRDRFVVNELTDHILDAFLVKLASKKFKYIYGYPNALLLFARYILQKGILLKDVSPSLECCIVTSEVCTPEDEAIMEKAFGMPIINEYGASEVGLIAFPDRERHWRLNCDDIIVEILDDDDKPVKDGEKGRIIITSLYNKAMPFIRYELGDIGSIKEVNGIKVLQQLFGRLNDTVRLPSGRVMPGATLHYASKVLMNNLKGLKEYNIKQTALDTFVYDIVADGEVDEKLFDMIEKVTFQYLEPGLKIKVNKVDSIKRSASGKFKHFQSFIDSPDMM